MLAEFGLVVPQEREVHVWDSSAELRYMVMPMLPPGAQDLSEDELASRITREALIGVAEVTLSAGAG